MREKPQTITFYLESPYTAVSLYMLLLISSIMSEVVIGLRVDDHGWSRVQSIVAKRTTVDDRRCLLYGL